MKRSDVPERFWPIYDQAMTGESRKAAMLAHCLICVGWNFYEVSKCTAPSCPLFPYRRSEKRKRKTEGCSEDDAQELENAITDLM